jgi:DNA/RNA-binding domain of Phe-tRNA-synthetase-like protein
MCPNHSPKHRSAKSRWRNGKDCVHLRSEQDIKEVMTRISNYRQLKVHLVSKNVRKILARMIEVKNTNETEVKKLL